MKRYNNCKRIWYKEKTHQNQSQTPVSPSAPAQKTMRSTKRLLILRSKKTNRKVIRRAIATIKKAWEK